jgi:hypothetical protein
MIAIDTYTAWYMSIMRHFITLTWWCFQRHPRNPIHYNPQYPRHNQLVCNIILHLLNNRIILLWMMTTN